MASKCSWCFVRAHSISVPVSSQFGLGENRGGDFDGVVAGKHSQDLRAGNGHRPQPDRKKRARGLFDGSYQPDKDIVDQINFIVGVLVRSDQEQISEMPQHLERRWSVLCAIELSSSWISSRGAPIALGTVLVGHGWQVELVNVYSDCMRGRFSNS